MISPRVYGSYAILVVTHGAVLRSKLSHLKDMDAYAFIVFAKAIKEEELTGLGVKIRNNMFHVLSINQIFNP
jgi:broad specificity phosphatase PhoE